VTATLTYSRVDSRSFGSAKFAIDGGEAVNDGLKHIAPYAQDISRASARLSWWRSIRTILWQ
jgi:hypothetical protein